MGFLAKAKKIDLQTLAVELGEKITEDLVVADLISLVKKSKNYEDEFAKNLLDTIRDTRLEREGLEEKQRAFQEKKCEFEEKQRAFELEKTKIEAEQKKRQFELEKLKIEATQFSPSEASHNDKLLSPRHSFVLQKIMHKFDSKEEDISLYLVIFERQAKRADVKKADWVTQLLPLLPSDIIQLIAREPESKSDNYDHVKDLLLKRFKFSPEKFRLKFVQHQKKNDSSWKDFTFELRNYLEEWIQGLEITSFD